MFTEGVLESDDGIEDDLALIVAYDVTINASRNLPDGEIRATLLGHQIDSEDSMLVTNTDELRRGALAWENCFQRKILPNRINTRK